jgi:hypothetical protein
MKLMRGVALLARSHQVEALKPLVQGNVAALHDGFHGDGEVFAARLLCAAELIYAVITLSEMANDLSEAYHRALEDSFTSGRASPPTS